MTSIYFNTLFPNKNEKVVLHNIDLTKNAKYLKGEVAKKLNFEENELELIFLGTILRDDTPLETLELRPMAIIHVTKIMKALTQREFDPVPEDKILKITKNYSSLPNSSFRKITRPENLKRVMDEFPEFRQDLIALSILKDPILLSSLQHPETIKNLNEHHRVLAVASELIFEILQESVVAASRNVLSPMQIDELSDSSSGSDGNSPSSTSRDNARRITADQLSAALVWANTSSNSLSNIAQRNLNSESQPSTSNLPNRITSSMFSNALTQVLSNSNTSTGRSGQSQPTPTTPTIITPDSQPTESTTIDPQPSYETELGQMNEMGLQDEAVNRQALLICNGNVDAAINFIFNGGIV